MPRQPTGRPRGRPKGSKNAPKLEAFVADSLAGPVPLPPRYENPRKGNRWSKLTPEERSAAARAMQAKRDASSYGNVGRKKGVPIAYTAAQWEAHKANQKPIIAAVMQRMARLGQLPDDPRAVEALEHVMLVLRSQVAPADRTAAARLVLDFAKERPVRKASTAIKSAEDFLDEMAADD